MEKNKDDMSKLSMMAMKDIPKPNSDAKQIVELVKKSGRITGYKLSDGRILGKDEGIQLARQTGWNSWSRYCRQEWE